MLGSSAVDLRLDYFVLGGLPHSTDSSGTYPLLQVEVLAPRANSSGVCCNRLLGWMQALI
jgi:hypothetical protein